MGSYFEIFISFVITMCLFGLYVKTIFILEEGKTYFGFKGKTLINISVIFVICCILHSLNGVTDLLIQSFLLIINQ